MRALIHLAQSLFLMFSRFRPLVVISRHSRYKNPHRTTATTSNYMCQETSLPTSLQGPPRSVLVKPGECQLGSDWTAVPLLERIPVSPTSAVLRFATPDRTRPLQLSTCACILAQAAMTNTSDDDNNSDNVVTRPYTPISTNADVGYFDLLVKNYGAGAHLSRHLVEVIQPGDTVNFKHIEFNVKIQAEELLQYDHIGMCVGGTGITPMLQALHAILGQPSSVKTPKVTMLYGSKTSDDILGKELLDQWAKDYPDKFTLVHILSDEPDASPVWQGRPRGFIDRDRIVEHFPKVHNKNDDEDDKVENGKTLIFVCGPPPMYAALSGPREDQDQVFGVLGELGYAAHQVYKF